VSTPPAALPLVAPYGSWRSPLTAAVAAAGATRFAALAVSQGNGVPRVWWAESLPSQGGRVAVMCSDGDDPVEVRPGETSARSRVNEYGGGVLWLDGEQPLWTDDTTQQIMRAPAVPGQSSWESPVPVTGAAPVQRGWRYAAGRMLPGTDWFVCERELHVDEAGRSLTEPVNDLVAVDLVTGRQRRLVGPGEPGSGDFTAAPVPSPNGAELAWLRWDHPDMPWDAAELWAGTIDWGDGPRLENARRVAGGLPGGAARRLGRPVAVCLPEWAPDGRLWWCDDAADWFHLRACAEPGLPPEGSGDGAPPAVPAAPGEEVGEPRWVSGGRRYGFTDDGRLVLAAMRDGLDSVWVVDTSNGSREPLIGPGFTHVELLCVEGSTVALVGGSPDRPTSVWRVDLATATATDLRAVSPPLEPDWISSPTPVTFPTGNGEVSHALFYPPASGDHVGPPDDLPPLVVRIHGGPTAAARPEFSPSVQFWTTRGFAVADVNYRGSTGFGRRYRDLLRGAWGVAEVDDCIAVTRYLSAEGLVDGSRCVIRGGSAGGFTALAALCFQADRGHPGAFAAACSLYGVTDLSALADDTHKFESRYLDGLVGPLPGSAEVYRSRSPLFHADRLDRPVLILQGAEDRVVPPSQAEVLVQALRRNAVPHAYLLFPGEGHGFSRSETIVSALEAELAFYGEVLGFDPADELPPLVLTRE
jgi:dipeptidyl aminopeptidase/acylaminoacyl peptidase